VNCMIWLLLLIGVVLVMLTMIRWFEQITEAVDLGWWNKTLLLMMFPFAVWFYPSRVAAGRPTPVPVHTPVRGFGMGGPPPPPEGATPPPADPSAPQPRAPARDTPPPGTPPEFLQNPGAALQNQPRPPARKPPVEQDKIEKLRQKMREQGMLDEE
jgi:hypothetical protein